MKTGLFAPVACEPGESLRQLLSASRGFCAGRIQPGLHG